MATSQQTITTAVTDDATFRTFVTNWKAGLEAVGLVDTAATGSINTGSVTKPAAASTVAGFTVHRFNDALQSGTGSLPVFIKTEYGTAASATVAALWVTVGTAHNGSGTLSGQVGTRFNYIMQTATAQTYYFSGENANRITIVGHLSSGTSGNNLLLNIERLYNSAGAATANGISTLYSAYGSSTNAKTQHQVIPASGNVLAQGATPVWPEPGSSLAFNNNVYYATMFPQSYQLHQPNTGLLKYWNADVTISSDVTVGVYGSNATYKVLGQILCTVTPANYGFPGLIGSTGQTAIAIRWQ